MSFLLKLFNLGGIAKEVTIAAPVDRQDPYGLHSLYPNEAYGSPRKTDIDIIAVHGLDGDPWATWTEEASGRNWLQDFLPRALPNARIMTFGYNSGVGFNNSVSTIEDFAKELLNRIRMENRRLNTDEDRPLIFICHSLGGIVVKKALILAHELEDRYGFIKKSCRGIIFLGTPHRGSAAADLAKVLSTVVNALTFSLAIPRNTLINDLRSDSGVLQTISKQFIRRTKGLEIISFYEREVFGAGSMSILTVDEDSATLGIVNEETIPINANHRNMCKFSHEGCQKYILVQSAVVEMVNNALRAEPVVEIARPDEELRLQILQWLSPDSIESPESSEEVYMSKLDEREDGTCNWFWENSDVKAWLSNDSSILWVHGPPGVGKSVLCSSIISKLDARHKVAYFFCVANQSSEAGTDAMSPKPNSPESILRSLVVQLIQSSPDFSLSHGLKELYRRQKWRKSCPNGDLKDILQWTLNTLPRTYIIIDGLDEVDELNQANPGQLQKLLKSLECKPLGIVKWLFTSQKTRAVDDSICRFKKSQDRFTTYREIDLADTEVDLELKGEMKTMIGAIIDEKFSDIPGVLKDFVLITLVHLTGGNFLCAKLLLNDLCDCPSIEDLMQSMSTYQPGLDNQYLRALRRIASVKRPCWADAAKKTLMYVTLALKPLTVCEVQAALSVDVEVIGQCGKSGMFAGDIKRLCLPLVRVCPKKGTMKLVHYSVKAFLLKQFESSKDWDTTGIEDFFIDEKKGNTEMALACLSYLSENRYSILPSTDQINLPSQSENLTDMAKTPDNECEDQEEVFLKYAAIFWHRHADAAEPTADLIKVVMNFFQSPNFITCLRVQSLYAPYHFGTFISSDGSSVAYADTVPGWLESNKFLGSKGKEMAFQYYSFVKEWGHVLGRYPGEIEKCLIGTLGNIFFSQVETVADAHFLGEEKTVQYFDFHASNCTSIADLCGEKWILTLKSRPKPPDIKKELLNSTESQSPQKDDDSKQENTLPTQTLELWHYNRENKPIPELQWSLSEAISVTSKKLLCGSKLLNCCDHPLKKVGDCVEWPVKLSPLVATPDLDYAIINGRLFRLREPGDIGVHSLQNPLIEFQFPPILCVPLGICLGTYGNHLAIGATWECEKCEPHDYEINPESNEDSSEEDSNSDIGSDAGSDAGSDVSVFAGTGFAPKAVSYAYFKLLVYDSGVLEHKASSHEFGGHCRVNYGENLFHYASPTFHPTHPLVAWALGPGEIIVADISTGDNKVIRASKIARKSDIITRELHFSKCGELLYEIKITIKITESAPFNSGKIFLTTYPVRDPSSPDNKVQNFKWRLDRPVANARGFKAPTTTWTADSVYISFSNIGLSVCRIDLLREGAKLFMSGTNIALSTSALQKSVHFLPAGDNDATVALAGSQGYGPSLISAKGLLHWEEKDWYSKIDFTVTGGGKAGVFYECDEPSFTVPVRSGVIWTERTVLECS